MKLLRILVFGVNVMQIRMAIPCHMIRVKKFSFLYILFFGNILFSQNVIEYNHYTPTYSYRESILDTVFENSFDYFQKSLNPHLQTIIKIFLEIDQLLV